MHGVDCRLGKQFLRRLFPVGDIPWVSEMHSPEHYPATNGLGKAHIMCELIFLTHYVSGDTIVCLKLVTQ